MGFMLQPFVKLKDPERYLACTWDLAKDDEGRAHWVGFFRRHINTILKVGVEAATARGESLDAAIQRAGACRQEFEQIADAFMADPAGAGRHGQARVTILVLDEWRDSTLRKHGFPDAFIDVKNRENERAIPLLAEVCRGIDALEEKQQVRAVVEGVFAGNIFDMGAEATAKQFLHAGPDFFETRNRLSPRPWVIDDFDAFEQRMLRGERHRKAVFFVDNAGGDFVLGAVPMMRWLARRGTRVVLAANETPTLNDMTIHDVNAWWPRMVKEEPSIGVMDIERVSTGTAEPLIDLSKVSAELNKACADADLVILEGMGAGLRVIWTRCFPAMR